MMGLSLRGLSLISAEGAAGGGVATFYILTEASDVLNAENGDRLITE